VIRFLPVLAVLLGSVFALSLEARVGETRGAIEARLLNSGGIVYRDEVARSNRSAGMPYADYLAYLPDSAEVRIYFKTADGRNPSSSELREKGMPRGWDFHVVYVGGKSVIEVYQRSVPMTEFERNQLLAINAGGGYWKRVSKEAQREAVTVFGFGMERSDGSLRARQVGRKGDILMIFDADLDKRLAEISTNDQQQKAPVSVGGF
jgi:hypothetical protein